MQNFQNNIKLNFIVIGHGIQAIHNQVS